MDHDPDHPPLTVRSFVLGILAILGVIALVALAYAGLSSLLGVTDVPG